MSSYADLKDEFKSLYSKRGVNTPQDLTEILDDIEVLFSKYGYSNSDTEREEILKDIEELIAHYYDIEQIIFTVGASVTPYNAQELLVTDEESLIPHTQYGVSGEFLLEKLHRESGLRKKSNTLHKLFVELIGRWFDEWDTVEQVRKYTLRFATGVWLDELASNFGIYRLENETDDKLRERIMQKRNELFTTPMLKSHDVTFFTCVRDPKLYLTSKNTYLTNDYLCYADDVTRDYYENTYVCWEDILWL